jgi:nitrogen fixation protein NifQ
MTVRPGFRRFARVLSTGRGGFGTPAADRAWTETRTCLLGWGAGTAADAPMASLLASLWLGRSALPPRLGLRAWGFRTLVRECFPNWPKHAALPQPIATAPCRLGQTGVAEEIQDLERLLLSGRSTAAPGSRRLAKLLAVGCMGYGHMWRDMGFASRAELRTLLTLASPKVVRRNVHDMRWKKFLYRELCKSEAGYVCRAPSCDVCVGYAECFGAEG